MTLNSYAFATYSQLRQAWIHSKTPVLVTGPALGRTAMQKRRVPRWIS
jgi:hypothetical protein